MPLSLVGTFAAMYILGFSLDNLSLMALTISTGFVVDDAIVMIENITRYVEAGDPPLEAALKGSRQIGFTIVSLTVSLIAVLIPLLFMGDVVGRLFHEFAVTLAVTIVISAVVSLTLVPMLCARLIRHRPDTARNRLDLMAERAFDSVAGQYGRALEIVLRHQPFTLFVAIATLGVTIALYIVIPKGFFPLQDTGMIQAISEAPQSTSFEAMAGYQRQLVEAILADPAVENVSSFIGVDGDNTTLNSGRFLISLKPMEERGLGATAIVRRLQKAVSKIAGVALYMQPVQDLTIDSGISRAQYHFILQNADPGALNTWVPKLMQQLAKQPELAMSQATCRARVSPPISSSTARPPRALASHRRASTMRSMTPSASASSRPSTRNRTSTVSSWKPTPRLQRALSQSFPILSAVFVLRRQWASSAFRDRSRRRSGRDRLLITHLGQFPATADLLQYRSWRLARRRHTGDRRCRASDRASQ